ncbi:MAG: Ribonuclease Y [Mycoplasmataceae bacterium]|nr:MAG: Ribonuclease Y [Mycoplasmataceae bacterium]
MYETSNLKLRKIFYLFLFIFVFLIIWSLILFSKIIEIRRKNLKIEKEKKKNLNWENNIREDQNSLEKKKKELEDQAQIFSQQIKVNLKKEELISNQLSEIKKSLFQISNMTESEARQHLFDSAKEDLKEDFNNLLSKQIKSYKEDLHVKITKIICSSLERYSSEIAFSKTVDYLLVDNKKTISRIIGKDGRNINSFRILTGTDIIIDKEKNDNKKTNEIVVEISSFDSLRREVALQTLKKLVLNDQKITPLYIEKVFNETSSEIDNLIFQTGENILEELQITGMDDELIKYLGRLKYRTSYGQNVLEHCLEVSKLSGTIAAEIGLNPTIAKRAGLLHDIGKAAEDLIGSSHVTSGVMLAKKYNESEIVINAIASHHDRLLANNPYSLIVAAADTLSAARPGSRSNQLESYISRMKGLENIAKEFDGIKKVYSFQAGREIWVIIDSNKVNDFQCIEISRNVKKRIQEKIVIPGDITISVIREKKIVEKIVNSGRISKSNPDEVIS